MRDNREQLEKVIELMGEGSTRRIRLTVLAVMSLVGVALQGWSTGMQLRWQIKSGVPWECRSGLPPLAPGF